MNTVDVINVLAREPLEFDPGTHWQYGRSHDALAALVETVSGMPFGCYVIQNVLEPLGIRDAHFRLTPDVEKRMACQYERRSEGVSITDIVRAQQYGARRRAARSKTAARKMSSYTARHMTAAARV